MSAYPAAAKVVVQASRVVKVVISRPRGTYARAATQNLAAGTREVVVTFVTPMVDTNWIFGALTFWNTADANVDKVQINAIGISAKSQSSFTVLLDTAPPTANYKMDWSIAEAYNP